MSCGSSRRLVEDVVDDQGDVVEHLERDRRTDATRRYRPIVESLEAAEDREGTEVLRAAAELPGQHVPHLFIGLFDPPVDAGAELSNLVLEAQLRDDIGG